MHTSLSLEASLYAGSEPPPATPPKKYATISVQFESHCVGVSLYPKNHFNFLYFFANKIQSENHTHLCQFPVNYAQGLQAGADVAQAIVLEGLQVRVRELQMPDMDARLEDILREGRHRTIKVIDGKRMDRGRDPLQG